MSRVGPAGYRPQPGSVTARVVEKLEALPPGQWMTSIELGKALGINTSQTRNMRVLLGSALRHGALRVRPSGLPPAPLEWSLGDGTPQPCGSAAKRAQPVLKPAPDRVRPMDTPKRAAAPATLPARGDVVMPPTVRVQVCPGAERDTRYQVDPQTFAGGELMAEWRRKRAASGTKAGA